MGICVEHLTKRYGAKTVFSDVSFEVPDNANLAIWGRNGAGKTTLVRILTTLDRPTSGQANIDGLDVTKQASQVRQRIGMLGHESMLYPDLTAEENLVLVGELYGVFDPKKRARQLLDMVGLSARRLDPVKTFSRGMTQRLALARALVHNPHTLFLDEPYTGLDDSSAAALDELLVAQSSDHTFVMISHDIDTVCAFASHVLILGGSGSLAAKRENNSRGGTGARFIDTSQCDGDALRSLLLEVGRSRA